MYFFFRAGKRVGDNKGFEFAQYLLQVVHAQAAQCQRVHCGVLVFLYLPFYFLQQSGKVCFQFYMMSHNFVPFFEA